jgi:hypothetical protein
MFVGMSAHFALSIQSMMRTIISVILGYICFISLTALSSYAQIPRQISYQGLIIDYNSNPIRDGVHTIEISFYDQLSGGTLLYTETHSTTTKGGIFNVILGTVTPFPQTLTFDRQYFLGVSVDGAPEMSPRTQLTAAPYAIRSGIADLAKGVSTDAKGVVTSINELDGPVRIVGDSIIKVTRNGQVISLSAEIPDITGVPFNLITSGTNKGQNLIVGDATKMFPTGKGEISANRLQGSMLSVSSNAVSYAGRVRIPKGASSLNVNLSPEVGCTPNSSVTVSQYDVAGHEILVGTMVTRIINNSFTVQFSAPYPTDTGQITYLIVNQ